MSDLTFNAIEISGSDVLVRDLAIMGPASASSVTSSEGIGIHISVPGTTGTTIVDVSMINVANGVLIDGTSEVYCERVRVQPFDAATTPGDRFGFRAQGTSGKVAEFLDCTVDESANSAKRVTAAFDCIGSYSSFLVAQCIALSTYYGFHCSTSGNFLFIANCLGDSCQWGLLLDNGIAALIEACRFSNSQFNGVEVQTTYSGSPISFSNVVIDGSMNSGAALFGASADQSMTFTGGAISNSGGDGLRIGVLGLLSVSGVSVEASAGDGVHIYNTHKGTVALSGVVESGATGFGFHVDAAATGTYVATGCSFSGDTAGAFSDGSDTPSRRCASTLGVNPRGNLNQSPLVGSPVTAQNLFGVVASVYISGPSMSVSKVEIGESPASLSDTHQTTGLFRVGIGEYIKVTFSTGASWVWFGD